MPVQMKDNICSLLRISEICGIRSFLCDNDRIGGIRQNWQFQVLELEHASVFSLKLQS